MYEPRKATWQRVRTTGGWHLRLMGANGEPILVSENYTEPATAAAAVTAAFFAAGVTPHEFALSSATAAIVDVDER